MNIKLELYIFKYFFRNVFFNYCIFLLVSYFLQIGAPGLFVLFFSIGFLVSLALQFLVHLSYGSGLLCYVFF